mmetsp:Transcript_9248/g.27791  ORF Transcript_9248/g.27791 Transcript_9248/m.27791 type:complete len:278 (+) Transcript_9248:505-1338(+)
MERQVEGREWQHHARLVCQRHIAAEVAVDADAAAADSGVAVLRDHAAAGGHQLRQAGGAGTGSGGADVACAGHRACLHIAVLEALAGGGVALVTLDHLILGIFWPQSGGVTLQRIEVPVRQPASNVEGGPPNDGAAHTQPAPPVVHVDATLAQDGNAGIGIPCCRHAGPPGCQEFVDGNGLRCVGDGVDPVKPDPPAGDVAPRKQEAAQKQQHQEEEGPSRGRHRLVAANGCDAPEHGNTHGVQQEEHEQEEEEARCLRSQPHRVVCDHRPQCGAEQ